MDNPTQQFNQQYPQSTPQYAAGNLANQFLNAPQQDLNSLSSVIGNLLMGIQKMIPTGSSTKKSSKVSSKLPNTHYIADALGLKPGSVPSSLLSGIGSIAQALFPFQTTTGIGQQMINSGVNAPTDNSVGANAVSALKNMGSLPFYAAKTNQLLPMGGEFARNIGLALLGSYLPQILGLNKGGAVGSAGNPIKMDLTPESLGPQGWADLNGTNLNGGSLPSFMYKNLIPEMTQNAMQSSVPIPPNIPVSVLGRFGK